MDFSSIQALILTFLGGSAGIWGLTELVKLIKFIPINEGQRIRIRSFVGTMSAIQAVFSGIANNNLDTTILQKSLITIVMFIGTFGGSHLIHKLFNKFEKNKTNPI